VVDDPIEILSGDFQPFFQIPPAAFLALAEVLPHELHLGG
jgi:hypothetical protein